MRRYDDPIEVRKGRIAGDSAGHIEEGPEQFLWRGRLWKVRSVIAHWVETGPWWTSPSARAVIGAEEPSSTGPVAADLLQEREIWRVEAARGALAGGVFDLAFDWSDGNWQLIGCQD